MEAFFEFYGLLGFPRDSLLKKMKSNMDIRLSTFSFEINLDLLRFHRIVVVVIVIVVVILVTESKKIGITFILIGCSIGFDKIFKMIIAERVMLEN